MKLVKYRHYCGIEFKSGKHLVLVNTEFLKLLGLALIGAAGLIWYFR